MTQPWQADVGVTPALARSLIDSQFPKLAVRTCREFGVGWDNTVFLVNGCFGSPAVRRAAWPVCASAEHGFAHANDWSNSPF